MIRHGQCNHIYKMHKDKRTLTCLRFDLQAKFMCKAQIEQLNRTIRNLSVRVDATRIGSKDLDTILGNILQLDCSKC